jgi:hypothetical protein
MLSEPVGSAVVEYVATPEEESGPVPRVVLPSMKVTEPVGTVASPEGPVTVAVKVTLEPEVMLVAEEESAVLLATCEVVDVPY